MLYFPQAWIFTPSRYKPIPFRRLFLLESSDDDDDDDEDDDDDDDDEDDDDEDDEDDDDEDDDDEDDEDDEDLQQHLCSGPTSAIAWTMHVERPQSDVREG